MKNVEDIYPLSPLQQGLLFHSVLAPGSGVYVNQGSYTLRGDLDVTIFRETWQRVVDRHAILRTAFAWEGLDEPLQAVRRQVRIPWREEDWRELSSSDWEARLVKLREAERFQPFDLTKAPLMRFVLVRRSEDEHVLVWTFHHILLDGWSTPQVLQEVLGIYGGLRAGQAPTLPPPRPYRDYIAWLGRQDLAATEAFWRRTLAGFESPTPLGIPAAESSRFTEELRRLGPEMTTALQTYGARHKVTLNTLVLGAWALLLSRYSGEEDVLFGSVVSGRPAELPGVESIVGLFINTLPVRVAVSGRQGLHAWIQDVQRHQIELLQHEHSPLVQIQKWSDIPPGSRLFDSLFVFENYPTGEWRSTDEDKTGLNVVGVRLVESTGYPLTLAAWIAGVLGLRLSYAPDHFEPAAAHRLLGHLSSLLGAISSGEDRPLSELPLISAAEARQIESWNDTRTEWGLDHCLHELIEARVDLAPSAVAVSFEGTTLSYRELDAQANRLAHRLLALGCGPEQRVALFLERSAELIVALLAVLKSGAAYLPLDPDHPTERITFQATDARPAVLLTQAHLAGRLPPLGATVLVLTPSGEEVATESAARPAGRVDPDHPAYVLYTSGSTGRPKGVTVPHRAIVNRLLWMQEAYGLTVADRVLQKTPYSFDVSVWEFFWPLIAGARLEVARPGAHGDTAWLVRKIQEEDITVMHFVPSMLRPFLEEPGVVACRSLRDVVASGEALTADLVQRFFSLLGARLHNLYGPTEAAVDVTAWQCEPGSARTIPIGRPIANTRIHLLNRDLHSVPVGVPGELYIGGVNLARGYFHRPDLTAERFLPDGSPSGIGEPGARLYRTGDLARYREDGAIEYLGRTDHQVKVRGFRIELGEIETTLLTHPAVREAAVVAPQRPDGHRRLVAYVVGTALPSAELRRFLLERLPEYMAPSLFVTLERLPLSSSGKIDRRALPEPDATRPDLEETFASPEGPTELALAEAWAEVLQVERVGRNDSFFALGGDSILSLQVLSKAREQGIEITLQQIFQYPTLRELAAQTQGGGQAAPLPRLEPFELLSVEDQARLPESLEDAYPLARLQAGMLFHSELDPESAVYHDISSVHLQAPYDALLLRKAVERVTALHPLLRTSFDLTGYSEPLQLVHDCAAVDFEVEDLRHLDRAEQEAALATWKEREKRRPLDWRRAPLLRFRILRRSEDSFQFIISFHHAILDGWSLAVLQADLMRIYLALIQGNELTEAPLPQSFRRFVALEREALGSKESQEYWSRQLADLDATRLPRRRQLPEEKGSGIHLINWTADLSARLMAAARPLGIPIKNVLLATHFRVLSVLASRSEVVTGLVTNGRPEEDGSDRALGLFLNTLPVRLATPGGTWNDLLLASFTAERELLPHRHYPMAELLRKREGHPLFEPVFNFVHFHVHQSFSQLKEVRSLGGEFFDRTEFTFLANFNLDTFTSRLQLRIDYDPDAFPAAQIETIAGYYDRTLTALAEDPTGRYETSSLLSAAEHSQVLQWGNDTTRPIALPPCIHQIFEAQVDLTPDAPALEMNGEAWSYHVLDQRANRLARLLRCRGVAVDDPVGICLERSPALAVAVLAVLKAGGAYLPLDPSYPFERLSVMVEEARLNLVLADGSGLESLQADWVSKRAQVIVLDSWGEAAGTEEPDRLPARATADSLAYVLYTSGSTGRPKGVAMPHGALVNLIGWQLGGPRPERGLRTLQFTSLGFDPSFEEMFSTWGSGGTLVLITEEERRDSEVLLGFLVEHRIERVFQPFVALQKLAETASAQGVFPISLRDLVTAGEQLQITPAVAELFRRVPDCRLFNQYGPTETHVTTAALLTDDPDTWPVLPSIGSPIANHRIYLLDLHGHPAPPDASGEIFVAGAGLARGYLHRPDLTAERFVPDSFSNEPGARLYRTGDLGRHLPDGGLEFLGRADRQVKIRGYRVEPGEVEIALTSHPAVRESAVVVHGDGTGRRLIAFVVAVPEVGTPSPVAMELTAYLRERLPEYMVPSAFLTVEALPLTSSGKVDRGALARTISLAELPRPELGRAFVAPRNPTEEVIARIWTDVLRLERVGVEDNLFEIGGHSLLATQIVVRIREALNIDLPLRTLYAAPTVAGLAIAAVQRQAEMVDAAMLESLLAQIEQKGAAGGSGR